MKTEGNSVLITGGATGIGYALARKFAELGNRVAVCGRREDKLDEAKAKLPGISTIRCDISKEEDRGALFSKVGKGPGSINILVNNAGIQRRIDLRKGLVDLLKNDDEIEINFRSQVYVTAMFMPVLLGQKEAAIVNVSSGLGFVPMAVFPIYSATKAAMHSFSVSLRHQLRDTNVRVFEAVPPTVHDTGLKGKELEKSDWSVSSKEMAQAIVKGMEEDRYEIGAGPSIKWMAAPRAEQDEIFRNINH